MILNGMSSDPHNGVNSLDLILMRLKELESAIPLNEAGGHGVDGHTITWDVCSISLTVSLIRDKMGSEGRTDQPYQL